MALSAAFKAVALKLQEQGAAELTSSDVCKWLSDALRDMDNGSYCYYVDHIGDGESGDVIYCSGGDLMRAPYEIRQVNGKSTATIDDENAFGVLPHTVYEPEADEADHYASMEAARLYQPGVAKLVERFISKAERDSADSGSFAGKGKSFPILKPGDVKAAVSSMGRAGSDNYDTGTLKRNIIRIAKKKGFTSSLPKAWQAGGDDSKEAQDIEITGDVIPLKEGAVGQDGTAYLKLIAPGRGTSGFYPAEVLKRDGPTVFAKGTKNFWNHQTDAEEASRPEGDLRDLASVLTEDAHYEETGPAGPGLYARAKVFENFRQPIDDLAKHIGMSIRASGKAKEGKAPDGKPGPIVEQLTRGISVDYVTTPGAGGQILQLFEAVRNRVANSTQGGADDMDAAEVRKLQESNRKLAQRLGLRDAKDTAVAELQSVRLPEATKARLIERIVGMATFTAEGELDSGAFRKLIEAEVKEEAAYLSKLTGGQIVTGMGSSQEIEPSKAERKEAKKARKREARRLAESLGFSGPQHKMGRDILIEGRQAFDPNYNSALNGVGVAAEE